MTEARDITEPPAGEPARVGGRRDGGPDTRACPVTPLGTWDGAYWFVDAQGQIRSLGARELGSKGPLLGLFGGDFAWLAAEHPAFDRHGEPTGWFAIDRAAAALMRGCVEAGLYDASRPLRGRGVWPHPDGLLLHCGDSVWVGAGGKGDWRLPGFRLGPALIRAMPPIGRPAPAPAPPGLIDDLRELVACWNWRERGAAKLVIGYLGAASLGAAIPWRAHILISGGAGCGKSALMELLAAATPHALCSNDFSRAGLQQALTSEARPILLDEGEGDERGIGHVERAIKFIRLMSSGGARVLRGSAGGTAQTFEATGAACIAAILPPILEPQDAGRITPLELAPLAPGADPEPVKRAVAGIANQAPALWARCIAGHGRYLENFATLRRLLAARGCDPRQADQPATLMAGWAMLSGDEALSEEEAAALIADCAFAIAGVERAGDDDGPQRCLQLLYSARPEVWRGGEKPTIGELLGQAMTSEGAAARGALRSLGLLIAQPLSGQPIDGLYVANRFEALARVYADTAWAAGKWAHDLRRLAGARPAPNSIWIGGVKTRATWIPAAWLPEPDDLGAAPDDEPP